LGTAVRLRRWFFPQPQERIARMASLEQRGDSYRIVFRHAGQKFTRSLKTSDAKQAGAMLARLEDNLRRVELGSLSVPPGCDVCTFLLSDGRLDQRPRPKHLIRTLGKLLDEYQARLPESSVEPTTLHCLKIHIGHFKRVLKASCPLDSLSLATHAALRRYALEGQGPAGQAAQRQHDQEGDRHAHHHLDLGAAA
jgi:hypothetical protein